MDGGQSVEGDPGTTAREGERSGIGRRQGTASRLLIVGAWLLTFVLVATVCYADLGLAPSLTVAAVAGSVVIALDLTGTRPAALLAAARNGGFTTRAAAIVAIGLVAALTRVPALVRAGVEAAEAPRTSLVQADTSPLVVFGSAPFLLWAARVIPPHATYTLLYGDNYKVPLLVAFWLQPRELTQDIASAQWIVLYGQSLPSGIRYSRRVTMGPGISAVEVVP